TTSNTQVIAPPRNELRIRNGAETDPLQSVTRQPRSTLFRYTTLFRSHIEQFQRGQQKEPDQTMAFRRVLQTAVLHVQSAGRQEVDPKSTRLNSSHVKISYAVFCLKKKNLNPTRSSRAWRSTARSAPPN